MHAQHANFPKTCKGMKFPCGLIHELWCLGYCTTYCTCTTVCWHVVYACRHTASTICMPCCAWTLAYCACMLAWYILLYRLVRIPPYTACTLNFVAIVNVIYKPCSLLHLHMQFCTSCTTSVQTPSSFVGASHTTSSFARAASRTGVEQSGSNVWDGNQCSSVYCLLWKRVSGEWKTSPKQKNRAKSKSESC